MITKLDSKDIRMLELSAKSETSKVALQEYLSAHSKAEVAWKVFRDSLLLSEDDNSKVGVKKKRKFKVGDKVRVLSANGALATAGLEIGDVAEVLRYTLRDDIVMLKSPHNSWYACFFESSLELTEEKTPNELRAEIIQRAKEFVEKYVGRAPLGSTTQFIEYKDTREVVASVVNGLWASTAKTHPDDVYNLHIGKAIALGRALNIGVSEFENAIHPTEPVVGHVVEGIESVGFYRRDRKFTLTSKQRDSFYYAEAKEYEPNEPDDFIFNDQIGKIVDDTNAQYSSSTDQGH